MSLNLEGIRAKVRRAVEHARVFRNESRQWMISRPYRIVQQANADSSRYRLIVKLIGAEAPLEKWTLILGDSVHNLRSALDHLIYAIAVHQTGRNPPLKEKGLGFPICDSSSKFSDSVDTRLYGISPELRTTIEMMQPYHRGHPTLPPILSILRDLDNADKHKLLRLAYATPMQGDIGFSGPQSPFVKEVKVSASYGEIKDGAELVSHTFDCPSPGMKYDRINLEISVALWHGKRDKIGPIWSERSDASALLTLMTAEVNYVIRVVSDRAR